MSLSRLWRDHDKRRQAQELLAGVYNGFTEGFGAADLAEARVMLEDAGLRSRAATSSISGMR